MCWSMNARRRGERRPRRRLVLPVALLVVMLLSPLLAMRPATVMAQDQTQDQTQTVDPAQDQTQAQDPTHAQDPGIVPVGQDAPVDTAVDTAVDAAQQVVVDDPSNTVLLPPPSAATSAPHVGPDPNWAPPSTVYVPETGQALDRLFLDLWRGWGGANAFGYPITPEFEENGHIVQYLGYARFEYWPEDPDNPVHLGDIGSEMRPLMVRRTLPGKSAATSNAELAMRAWLPLDKKKITSEGDDYRFISPTKHSVSGAFKTFWENTGEDTYLGNPLTEQYTIHDTTYQMFERGQVALDEGGDPYLMPVGELLAQRKQLDTSPVPQGDLPDYSEDLFVPPPPKPAAPAQPQVDPNAEKWLEVSLSQQYAWARQGDVVLWEGYVSTGKEKFETPAGTFFVNSKLKSQTMEGVIGGEYYDVPDVPNVMYFTDRGHAIHGTYWHNNFGTPMSHGCVNLPMDVAEWMYGWAPLGMRVDIHD